MRAAKPIAVPPGLRALPSNRGLEALVFVPKGLPLAGTLIAISERGLDRAGNITGFLIGGPLPGRFAVKRSASYDPSDAALLPGGDLLLLERKFSWTGGLPFASGGSRSATSSRARWSMDRPCSRPISAMRSTTWRA